MNDPSDPSESSIAARLRGIGSAPIDDATRSNHLSRARAAAASGSAPEVHRQRRFGPVAVGAAAMLGFLAGSTGLAMAGALPDAAQDVAHDVLGVVQVDVPQGREGKRGPCVAEAAKLDDEEAKRAAKEACPGGGPDADPDGDAPGRSGDAPGKSGDAPGRSGDRVTGTDRHADDPCRGKPPWAGPMSQEYRAALKQEFTREECVDDDSGSDESSNDDPSDLDED